MAKVRLGDGAALALKLANLVRMAEVELVELSAEHDNKKATVFERDDEAEMYGVELPSGESLAVGFGSVLLGKGAHGVVGGLQVGLYKIFFHL